MPLNIQLTANISETKSSRLFLGLLHNSEMHDRNQIQTAKSNVAWKLSLILNQKCTYIFQAPVDLIWKS